VWTVDSTRSHAIRTKSALPECRSAGGFAVSPDGSRFLLARASTGVSGERISVIENWTELMKLKK